MSAAPTPEGRRLSRFRALELWRAELASGHRSEDGEDLLAYAARAEDAAMELESRAWRDCDAAVREERPTARALLRALGAAQLWAAAELRKRAAAALLSDGLEREHAA